MRDKTRPCGVREREIEREIERERPKASLCMAERERKKESARACARVRILMPLQETQKFSVREKVCVRESEKESAHWRRTTRPQSVPACVRESVCVCVRERGRVY